MKISSYIGVQVQFFMIIDIDIVCVCVCMSIIISILYSFSFDWYFNGSLMDIVIGFFKCFSNKLFFAPRSHLNRWLRRLYHHDSRDMILKWQFMITYAEKAMKFLYYYREFFFVEHFLCELLKIKKLLL